MNSQIPIDQQLGDALRHAVAQLLDGQPADQRQALVTESAQRWEIPKDPSFGDLSNSLAFKLASARRQAPPIIADLLSKTFLASCRAIRLEPWVERVETKAGYLNVFLSQEALIQVLRGVLARGPQYGAAQTTPAPSINIEFVSANPTGPLSVAHGRQAVVGDVLARLLRSQGWQVTTEYYLNDEGRQVEQLGRSLRVRYVQLFGRDQAIPEDGYHGAYLCTVAEACQATFGDRLVEPPESDTLPTFMAFAKEQLLACIRQDLAAGGLTFDQWTSQTWLRTSGRLEAALEQLRARGALYEAEDATWLASTTFGDDKDRVVRKRDGELTYLAPDIAYHQWKFERGYDHLLNLWGPDHHGYIARVKAAIAALGLPADRLQVRIVQLVTLSRHGTVVPMSKRQGEFVTFREIMDEVGVDATRFFYLMRTMDSQLDFDLELAKSQSQENPVYYVQYAHARICSILAKAGETLQTLSPPFERLQAEEERLLVRTIFQYPIILRMCAGALEPHGVTTYLRKLAEVFHVFYTKHRVITDDQEQSAARLALIMATRHTLANGLGVLGISAPDRM